MDEFLAELRAGFIVESREMLIETEPLFQELENGSSDAVDGILRVVHDIKGSALATQLVSLSKFVQRFETLLSLVRSGQLDAEPHLLTLIVEVARAIKTTLDIIEKDPDSPLELETLEARVKEFTNRFDEPEVASEGIDEGADEAAPSGSEISRKLEAQFASSEKSLPIAPKSAVSDVEVPEPSEQEWDEVAVQVKRSIAEPKPQKTTSVSGFSERNLFDDLLSDDSSGFSPVSTDPSARGTESVVEPEPEQKVSEQQMSEQQVGGQKLGGQKLEQGDPAAPEVMPASAAPVRSGIGLESLDRFMNMTEGVLSLQLELFRKQKMIGGLRTEIQATVANLAERVTQLRSISRSIRMIPLEEVFDRLIAGSTHFSNIKILGESAEIDRGFSATLEGVLSTLLHEAGDVEESSLEASTETSTLLVTLRLNGEGGSASEVAGKWDSCLLDVCPAIEGKGGTVRRVEKEGSGISIEIRLPRSGGVLDMIWVRSGPNSFLIPAETVVGKVTPVQSHFETHSKGEVSYRLKGTALPANEIGNLFNDSQKSVAESAQLLVIQVLENRYVVGVDEIKGRRSLASESLGANLSKVKGVQGVSVLEGQELALVVNLPALLLWKLDDDSAPLAA